MVTLSHYLILAAVLFSISIAGIVINRKNIIILLMSIELMLTSHPTSMSVLVKINSPQRSKMVISKVLKLPPSALKISFIPSPSGVKEFGI